MFAFLKPRKPNTDVAYKPDLTPPNNAKNEVICKVKFYRIFYNNFFDGGFVFARWVFWKNLELFAWIMGYGGSGSHIGTIRGLGSGGV